MIFSDYTIYSINVITLFVTINHNIELYLLGFEKIETLTFNLRFICLLIFNGIQNTMENNYII